MGAEIIKIEAPEGDSSRRIPPYFHEGDSSFFLSVNRGKKSVCLDLKNPAGRSVLVDLVKRSDAIIYGFRPDVPKRLGLDFETLSQINEKICVGELIGLHHEGDYATAPAFDIIVQAMSGLMSITGEANGAPVRSGHQIADLAGGLYLALGVLGALLKRSQNGLGNHVQISLLDCQLALLTWQAQNYLLSGDVPAANGSRHHMIAPSEVFRCADGRFLAVTANGDAFWEKLCDALDRPELRNDARFATADQRIANVDALSEALSTIFKSRTSDEWNELLFAKRVPAGRVNDVAEALAQPLVDLRCMLQPAVNPRTGNTARFLSTPLKFVGAEPLSYPPALGAHTREVLEEICGYTAAQIDDLARNGAVAFS
jgi:CoA:oxalate CoA-transferase